MDREAFIGLLAAEQFDVVVTVQQPANGALDVHTHAFEAKALIVEGAMWIAIGDTEQAYQVGQVFYLSANAPHSERYGPAGVTYLVGRK